MAWRSTAGDDLNYPFGMHPLNSNAPGFFHDWAHQSHALVVAGMALIGRTGLIGSGGSEFVPAAPDCFRALATWRYPKPLSRSLTARNDSADLCCATARQATKAMRYAGLRQAVLGNNMASTQVYFRKRAWFTTEHDPCRGASTAPGAEADYQG